MANGLHEIIDLYSKFLLAFVGIVTPALTLFLNSYLIDRRGFQKVLKTQEGVAENQVKLQYAKIKNSPDADVLKFIEESNKELNDNNAKIKRWEVIYEKLNPRKFFATNLKLLAWSMFFLFLWLFIRTEKMLPHSSIFYQPAQILACFSSVGLCAWHLFNLQKIGFFLIDVRADVDDINDYIKEEKAKKKKQLAAKTIKKPK